MEGRRAPQGLDAEDRIAWGLTAPHLGYLVVCSLGTYAVLSSQLHWAVKYPIAVCVVALGAALAWGRLAHRSLDTWLWLAVRFYLRPRSSGAMVNARNSSLSEPREPIRPATTPLPTPRPEVVAVDLPAFFVADAVAAGGSARPSMDLNPATEKESEDEWKVHGPENSAAGDLEDQGDDEEEEDDADDKTIDAPEEPRILNLPTVRDAQTQPSGRARSYQQPGSTPQQTATPVFIGSTQRIAFFSLKGGVGKTTLATEVAALLARDGQHRESPATAPERLRVALLDVDMGSANVSMKLGLTHPTLWDLVLEQGSDNDTVQQCLVEHEDSGLHVLLGPPRAIANSDSRALAMHRVAQVLSLLDDQKFHFVFIDMSGEVNELTTYLLEAVHHIYYVLTPTASGVQDTYRGVETLRRMGHRRKLRFILNQARGGFDASEMLADLGGTLAATVPRDDAFLAAEDAHQPAALGTGSAARDSIVDLSSAIYPSFLGAPATASVWRRLRHRLG